MSQGPGPQCDQAIGTAKRDIKEVWIEYKKTQDRSRCATS